MERRLYAGIMTPCMVITLALWYMDFPLLHARSLPSWRYWSCTISPWQTDHRLQA
jgi:uncharacterized membrane protein